jgi:hypothetical protein
MAANANASYNNPAQSMLARDLPRRIAEHHLLRAKQVLALNQAAGRFDRRDYETFVGKGGSPTLADIGFAPGADARKPPGTTRRSLETIDPDYLPFPGRIIFASARTGDLIEALQYFMTQFRARAPRSNVSERRKGHSYRYADSLLVKLDNTFLSAQSTVVNIDRAGRGTVVEIVNIAPHSSTVEVDYPVMYAIAVEMAQLFAPGISIVYDYVASDKYGLRYGRGTGGPTRAGRTGVYALPRIILAVTGAQAGAANINTRIVQPGRRVSFRTRKRRNSGRRG